MLTSDQLVNNNDLSYKLLAELMEQMVFLNPFQPANSSQRASYYISWPGPVSNNINVINILQRCFAGMV
jgi:hypothetical protein